MSSEKDEEIFSRVPEIHPSEIEMETLIGEGSYGQVYSGKCRGKTVAIKGNVYFFFDLNFTSTNV